MHTEILTGIDFSRHRGVLDHALLAGTHIACVGLGGAAGLLQSLTGAGIRSWTQVDYDRVSLTNPATQAHDFADRGKLKCEALAERLVRIDPKVHVRSIAKRYQDLSPDEHDDLWSADLILAMTDDFDTQALINVDAVRHRQPTIFANCYIGCGAVEVTASFPETIANDGGCHRCHVKTRYDGYAAGFENPADIPSHRFAADYLNALIGLTVLGYLHWRAGSNLAIAEVGREFAARPCLISRILPSFGSGPGEAFPGAASLPFTSSLWPLDTPSTWQCPDCGTTGPIKVPEFPCPKSNPGPGATAERS
jgi:hypothetical protein